MCLTLIKTRTVTEWNVGCEKCHGAGSAHVKSPIAETIVNPAKLAPRAAEAMPQISDQARTYVFRIRKGIYFARFNWQRSKQ